MRLEEKERKSLFQIGWILLILGVIIIVVLKVTQVSLDSLLLPCLIHKYTGLYCPGCGGSRAFSLFLKGHILQSLYFHPVVAYGMVLYLWFMISNSVEWLTKGRLEIGMYYKDRYVVIAVIIVVLNCIIKNAILIIWKYPMIA